MYKTQLFTLDIKSAVTYNKKNLKILVLLYSYTNYVHKLIFVSKISWSTRNWMWHEQWMICEFAATWLLNFWLQEAIKFLAPVGYSSFAASRLFNFCCQ